MDVNCLLFDDFELLDLFGPVEVLGNIAEYTIKYFSMNGGTVNGRLNAGVATESIAALKPEGILIIPGGRGTRTLVDDAAFIGKLRSIAEESTWCLTICTGSALLAKTGLLDGRNATSNKMAFRWVEGTGEKVRWVYRARWVVDGKYYTSSGVSAGIDMALGFVHDRFSAEKALKIASRIEYDWRNDKDHDPFADARSRRFPSPTEVRSRLKTAIPSLAAPILRGVKGAARVTDAAVCPVLCPIG
jgi:transcriptional regulator GlxA family with amidase domain